MYYKGLLKRIVPFFLTFAAGLFIASFFVTIATPSFNGFRRGSNKHREIQRLKTELNETKKENCDLKKQIREIKQDSDNIEFGDYSVPPVNLDAPPAPPKAPRHPRFDR